MSKIRVLVVDDAVVMRRLVTEAIQRDPTIEVVGTAPHGRVALQKLDQINPDLVTLDVEMPEMDGITTLRELRRARPRLPVIMLSALTQRGGHATLDALAAGANDYVTKPSQSESFAASVTSLAIELQRKIPSLCPGDFPPPGLPPLVSPPVRPAPAAGRGRPIDLLVIATSTGGPNALADLFQGITSPVPVPVAIVQHMPPMFTKLLAARLDALGVPLRCHEAEDGDILLPGHAYLAPGGKHLSVSRDARGHFVGRLLETPPENSCRPAADVLFRSAAATGAHLLGVVLTGMGQDGMRGAECITERGGEIIAQDQATSVVWGMPGAVVHAGLARSILPLPQIAGEILRRLGAFAPALA